MIPTERTSTASRCKLSGSCPLGPSHFFTPSATTWKLLPALQHLYIFCNFKVTVKANYSTSTGVSSTGASSSISSGSTLAAMYASKSSYPSRFAAVVIAFCPHIWAWVKSS